jgi:hypothetical protein
MDRVNFMPHALSDFLYAVCDLYDTEGRTGGAMAASALRRHANTVIDPQKWPNAFETGVPGAIALIDSPLARLSKNALYMRWGGADLRGRRLPEDLSNAMPFCELIGPNGMFFDKNVRVGLWMQNPGMVYGPRSHAAEETFYILSGKVIWWNEDDGHRTLGRGEYVFHNTNPRNH